MGSLFVCTIQIATLLSLVIGPLLYPAPIPAVASSTNAAAKIGNGSFPQMLTDPSLITALREAAQAFREGFAGVPRKLFIPAIRR